MRLIKLFILALIASVSTIAFLGTGSAMATGHPEITFCLKNEPLLCNPTWYLEPPPGGKLRLLVFGGKGTLSGAINEECEKSKWVFETTESMGKHLEGEITELTFSNCKPCTTVTANGLPWKAHYEMAVEGGSDYSLPASGYSLSFSGCPGGNKCKFGTETAILKAKNSEEGGAEIIAEKLKLTLEEGLKLFCGESTSYSSTEREPVIHLIDKNGTDAGLHTPIWLSLILEL